MGLALGGLGALGGGSTMDKALSVSASGASST